jgi:hypothetical protein
MLTSKHVRRLEAEFAMPLGGRSEERKPGPNPESGGCSSSMVEPRSVLDLGLYFPTLRHSVLWHRHISPLGISPEQGGQETPLCFFYCFDSALCV